MLTESEALFDRPWPELQATAWGVRRRHHPDVLVCSVPGVKRYDTEHYHNTPHRFASISLTGRRCALRCEHCRGQLLEGMLPAPTPEALLALGQRLLERGCEGVLVSGGADANGAVPLESHLPAMAQLKEWGLQVIVHTGLLDRRTAEGLKAIGVDQVLFDVVGDAATIHQVLHLDRSPEDYAQTLALLSDLEIPVAPHIVVGLHFGRLGGELAALEMISQTGAAVIVFVVLRPLPHTPMADLPAVDPEAVGRLAAVARVFNPTVPITLGCARPAGLVKIEIERRAVLAGVNGVAYPDPTTVRLAGELGLCTPFVESCCSLTTSPATVSAATASGAQSTAAHQRT